MKKYILLSLSFSFVAILAFVAAKNPSIQAFLPAPVPSDSPLVLRADAPGDLPVSNKKHKIQIALLLDTSNSMDGLIEQAKSQLWKLVNELALVKKEKEAAGIEIALYEYGNDGLSAHSGYVRQVAPLTTDLDFISQHLFSLRTNGGQEYCGWAMKDGLENLRWSENGGDLKLIVIAGNEPFNQGSVDYKTVCKAAGQRGICINTIFCGDYQEGVSTFWKDGADCACGTYTNINHNDVVQHIPTPYDQRVAELNSRLNDTYIQYGAAGEEKKANQSRQDSNAAAYGDANTRTRSFFKSKEQYKNSDWDLVDKAEEDEAVLQNTEDLPAEMKAMDKDERKAYVEKKKAERTAIQKELLELEQKVNEYIAKERQQSAEKLTLDNVMVTSLKKQAKEKGFE